MIKVNTLAIRDKLMPVPKDCLGILRRQLPMIVKSRIKQQQAWLEEKISAIKNDPKGVSGYVKQIQTMENIDQNF